MVHRVALATALAIGASAAAIGGSAAASEGERRGAVTVVEHRAPDMVRIPAGPFWMGAPDSREERDWLADACLADYGPELSLLLCFDPDRGRDVFDDARPYRQVQVSAFDIDRHEVTTDEYRACVRAGGCDPSPLLVGDQRYHGPSMPLGNVTWREAAAYCAFVGKRLPTEAEWEKAARGTDGRRWPWGNFWREDGSNHGRIGDEVLGLLHGKLVHNQGRRVAELVEDDSDGARAAVPPGTMRWSDSPRGVFDMSGNAAEWVQDFYSAAQPEREGYEDLPSIDPVRLSPVGGLVMRVVRGGSWREPRLWGLTYARGAEAPSTRRPDLGFRCARHVE